mgnify:CR=1 FL=1
MDICIRCNQPITEASHIAEQFADTGETHHFHRTCYLKDYDKPKELNAQDVRMQRQQLVDECREKLTQLLIEYNCDLVGLPYFRDGRVDVEIKVVERNV